MTDKPQLRCAKCHYEWQQRGERAPKECPQCKSRYWQATPAPAPATGEEGTR